MCIKDFNFLYNLYRISDKAIQYTHTTIIFHFNKFIQLKYLNQLIDFRLNGVQKNFSYIYTKTFGGKIWTNLHRVSPGNTFGKKLNRVVFEAFPAKKLCSISYRNSVEFSIFLVPLKFCHSISLSLQVSGTRYCTHTR